MDLQGIIPGAFEQKNIIYLIKIHLAGAIKCIKPKWIKPYSPAYKYLELRHVRLKYHCRKNVNKRKDGIILKLIQ